MLLHRPDQLDERTIGILYENELVLPPQTDGRLAQELYLAILDPFENRGEIRHENRDVTHSRLVMDEIVLLGLCFVTETHQLPLRSLLAVAEA
jgi:hypothetical protein